MQTNNLLSMPKQRTLKEPFSLTGKGLHTGLKLTARFCPAPAGYGYKIERIDVPGKSIIEVLAENVHDTPRGTIIENGSEHVSTIEHGLAALYALGIDNCHICVDGPEFPILDGSSAYYVQHIQRVGVVEQDMDREILVVDHITEFYDEQSGSRLTIEPADEFSLSVMVSFENSIIRNQHAELSSMSAFATEVASARTFVFVRDLEPLLNRGLIRGGDLDNAIVIYERQLSQEQYDQLADILKVPRMDATRLGYIMNRPLVWDNEPARHKLLDVIGDLALTGRFIQGHVIAEKPGHKVNNQFARKIRQEYGLAGITLNNSTV